MLLVLHRWRRHFVGPPIKRGGQRSAPHPRRRTLCEPAPPPEVICDARPRDEARCDGPPLQPLQQLPHDGLAAGGGVGPCFQRQRERPDTQPKPQRPPTLLPRQKSEEAGSERVCASRGSVRPHPCRTCARATRKLSSQHQGCMLACACL